MKTDTMLDAIGMIDDRFIEEAHRSVHLKKSRYRSIAVAAAAVICIALPLPAATAAGSETAYAALYSVFPTAAQTFKPVQMSCIDNGIKMEVISADINGSEASVCLSMQDLESDRLDKTIDLFDCYNLNIPFDSSSHCSFTKYDPDTKTAYFMVHTERMDGKDIPERKVTFSVSKFLAHKQHIEGYIYDIDLNSVSEIPETFRPEWINGCADGITPEIAENMDYLIPSETPLCYAADGMGITGIGFVDGQLHLQIFNETKHMTDNHGFISIIVGSSKKITPEGVAYFQHGDNNSDSYEEYVFDITPEELADARLYGEFVIAPPCIEGKWQITFRLDK